MPNLNIRHLQLFFKQITKEAETPTKTGGTTRKEFSRDNSFLFHRHNPVRRSATVKRLPDRSKRIELCSETPPATAGEANIDLQFFIFVFNSYFCKIIYILET